MVKTPLIIGNWKMHKTVDESIRLATELKNMLSGKRDVEVAVAPPFTAINSVSIALQDTNIALAAQNCGWEDEGAFTGEVSPAMLTEVGVMFVILGHSERRHLLGESNTMVNRKIRAAVENGLKPVLCVGETLSEHESDKSKEVVEFQLKESLKGFRSSDITELIVAYEPVWAIGTGKTASPEYANQMHAYIQTVLADMLGGVAADRTRILYGGSVNAENAVALMSQSNVDGLLVGGASLQSEAFASIVMYDE